MCYINSNKQEKNMYEIVRRERIKINTVQKNHLLPLRPGRQVEGAPVKAEFRVSCLSLQCVDDALALLNLKIER